MNAPAEVKISADGVYDIPMSVYHQPCCAGFSTSASRLIYLDQTCPAKFWWQSELNPNRPSEADTTAMAFGRLVHCLLFDGAEAFKARYVCRPEGLNFSTKEGKAWRAEQTAEIVTYDDALAAAAMVEMIGKHPLAARAFRDGLSERSVIAKDPITGIWLKARPDFLPNSLPFVPNYKTAASSRPRDWVRQAIDLGYHQSAALTVDLIRAVLDREVQPYFVVQEKEPPYVVTIMTMKDTDIEWGRLINRRAIDTIARCLEANHWPGYAEDAVEVWMPPYEERVLQLQHEAGLFQDAALNISRLRERPSPELTEPV